MNKILNQGIYCFTGMLLIISGCRSHFFNEDYVKPIEMAMDPANRVGEIKQELLSNGVDTLFVYARQCKDCYDIPVVPKEREEKRSPFRYSRLCYAEPFYIFWISKGHYFVKKVDQFYEYETIERRSFTQFPLYDYFLDNKKMIRDEDYYWGKRDTLSNYHVLWIRRTEAKYYIRDKNSISTSEVVTNSTDIEFVAHDFSLKKELEDDYFNAVAPEKFEQDEKQKFRKDDPDDSLMIVNNKENYMRNRNMKIFIWTKLVDSELLDIEMKKLWFPVENKKKS
jgi:hypothetical protein